MSIPRFHWKKQFILSFLWIALQKYYDFFFFAVRWSKNSFSFFTSHTYTSILFGSIPLRRCTRWLHYTDCVLFVMLLIWFCISILSNLAILQKGCPYFTDFLFLSFFIFYKIWFFPSSFGSGPLSVFLWFRLWPEVILQTKRIKALCWIVFLLSFLLCIFSYSFFFEYFMFKRNADLIHQWKNARTRRDERNIIRKKRKKM